MLTPAELAAHLRISERTVARMVLEGCPSMLARRRRRFDLAAVTAWMAAQGVNQPCQSEKTMPAAGTLKPASAAAAFTAACRQVQLRAMPSASKLS